MYITTYLIKNRQIALLAISLLDLLAIPVNHGSWTTPEDFKLAVLVIIIFYCNTNILTGA